MEYAINAEHKKLTKRQDLSINVDEFEDSLVKLPDGNVGETPISTQSFNRMSHLFKSKDEIVCKSKPYQSYFNSVKIFLGNAYLTIPNVFKRTGWIGGIVLLTVIALLNCISMSMVMKSA